MLSSVSFPLLAACYHASAVAFVLVLPAHSAHKQQSAAHKTLRLAASLTLLALSLAIPFPLDKVR